MAGYLKPHTREWLEALMRVNASQAIHTAAVIRAADHEDVARFVVANRQATTAL